MYLSNEQSKQKLFNTRIKERNGNDTSSESCSLCVGNLSPGQCVSVSPEKRSSFGTGPEMKNDMS